MGTGFVIYTMAGPRSISAQKNAATEAALAQVKQALIGWSASRIPTLGSPNIRPGELPCPDMNDNGLDDDGSCVAGAIGRVPWQTLGIPRPLDGSGETLWYAISGPYRYKYSSSTPPITSDTLGNLTVYQGSSAATQTSQAIAILFAPGAPLGTQARGTTTGLCSTTSTTIQQRFCATNYLEATGGGFNAQTGGPFIQAVASGVVNDRVLAITNADLMPLVEQRAAQEMMSLLEDYYNAVGDYPWADISDGNSNHTSGDATNRARFPCGATFPYNWGDNGTPSLPDWLSNGCASASGWPGVIYYTVSKSRLESSGSICSSCTSTNLNITNSGWAYLCTHLAVPFTCTLGIVPSGSARLILITSGASTGGRNWPDITLDAITGYFDDAENSNNDDDTYVIPATSNNPNRDRMYIVR